VKNQRQNKVIHIDLNRKLMTHAIIDQLRDTAKANGMLSGGAILEVLDEYNRLRYLVEGITTAYMRGDEQKVRQVLDTFQVLL
jgi:hypothetical protein